MNFNLKNILNLSMNYFKCIKIEILMFNFGLKIINLLNVV